MYIKINEMNLYYELIGEGIPILILHGYTLDHTVMKFALEPIFKNLEGYQRIYLDLPGMGKSQEGELPSNSDEMLEIVLHFIEKVFKNDKFLIIGYSYGAYLGQGILYKKAKQVNGVCYFCPLVIAERDKRRLEEPVLIEVEDEFISTLDENLRKKLLEGGVIVTKNIWDRYQNEITLGQTRANMEYLDNFFETGYPFSFNIHKLLPIYNKPSLIMTGKQDGSVGYKDAWLMLDKLFRATFIAFDKASHILHLEQTELFNKLILEWINRVELENNAENLRKYK